MTVLVLAPHPDDEAIGCGASLRLHADAGTRVVVLFLTSGEAGLLQLSAAEAQAVREAEAADAAAILGLARTVFLRGPDWSLRQGLPALTAAVRRIVEQEQPSTIYLPHTGDAHPDHQAVWSLLPAILPADLETVLTAYEVWTPLDHFDEVVDVSRVLATKLAAIRCYRSQLEQLRYDVAAEGLARYRGALAGGCEAAEVFRYETQPSPQEQRPLRAEMP